VMGLLVHAVTCGYRLRDGCLTGSVPNANSERLWPHTRMVPEETLELAKPHLLGTWIKGFAQLMM
jgi:hypothetical protein